MPPATMDPPLSPADYLFDRLTDLPERRLLPEASRVRRVRLTRLSAPLGTVPRAEIETDEDRQPLAERIRHHDTSGEPLDWAHRGPLSRDLALNLLLLFVSPKEAWRLHEPFAGEMLWLLPPEEAMLEGRTIRSWIETRWREELRDSGAVQAEAAMRQTHMQEDLAARIRRMDVEERVRLALEKIRERSYDHAFRLAVYEPGYERVLYELVRRIDQDPELAWIVDSQALPVHRYRAQFQKEGPPPPPRARSADEAEDPAALLSELGVTDLFSPQPAPAAERKLGSEALRRALRALSDFDLWRLTVDLRREPALGLEWARGEGLPDDLETLREAAMRELSGRDPSRRDLPF